MIEGSGRVQVGDTVGRLTVLGRYISRQNKRSVFLCACECSAMVRIDISHLGRGTLSCGCWKKEAIVIANLRHGHAARGRRSTEHAIWTSMLARCGNPKNRRWDRYGGRGITVCQRWKDDFTAFLADMGLRPSPHHSLDREKNDEGYNPENCRWATRREQANNTSSNVVLCHDGKRGTIAQWAAWLGVSPYALYMRWERGWTTARILTQSVRRFNPGGTQ